MKTSLNITNLTFAKALTVTRNTQSHKFVNCKKDMLQILQMQFFVGK